MSLYQAFNRRRHRDSEKHYVNNSNMVSKQQFWPGDVIGEGELLNDIDAKKKIE